MDLPDELVALLRRPSPCYVATLMPDGQPQMTQTWVDTDGEHVLVNTVQGFQKHKNVLRDPRVALNVSDPETPSRYFAVRDQALLAHATQVDPEGAWFSVPLDLHQSSWPTEDWELVRSEVETTVPEDDLFAGIAVPAASMVNV